MALPVLFWQYQPWTWWVKTRNFYSSNSNYHRCRIFTSRYMFSKQARTIELVRSRMPVSKAPQYPIWPPFLPKMFVIPHQNMKLMLINHFQNSETSAMLRIVLLSLLEGECAMQLYFMALVIPMKPFVLHLQLSTSMIAGGIGSKVIMTGISLSSSYLTPLKYRW